MVLQMDDCIQVLNHLYPQFEYVFLFDHSNGHDRMKPNGLNINKIRICHGGKQPCMRNSTLSQNKFGPFHNNQYTLQPGMSQSMQFSATDVGPCYLSEEKRRELRYDKVLPTKKKIELTKAQLVKRLKAAGKNNSKGYKKDLQTMCTNMGIPTSIEVDEVVPGWVNKPKGSLQILFEKGWIHHDRIHLYTEKGKTINGIAPGNLAPSEELSIRQLMKLQNDFMTESTLLQFYGEKLGITVDRTPKCHPELAGEDIEYAWAIAKLHY